MRSHILVQLLFLLPTSIVWAGGATSGGGHDLGLQVKKIISNLALAIEKMEATILPPTAKAKLLIAARSVKVAAVSGPLPAPVDKTHRLQNGAAFSSFDGIDKYLIEIDQYKWPMIEDPLIEEGVLFHELAVMANLETTSDYTYTDQFLLARESLWREILSEKFYCVVSVLKLSERRPPHLIGSQLIYSDDPASIKSNWSIIGALYDSEIDKHASIVLQWVFGANGYLRSRLVLADALSMASGFKVFSNPVELLPQILIHSPYDKMQTHSQTFIRNTNGYQLMSSCAKDQ